MSFGGTSLHVDYNVGLSVDEVDEQKIGDLAAWPWEDLCTSDMPDMAEQR